MKGKTMVVAFAMVVFMFYFMYLLTEIDF